MKPVYIINGFLGSGKTEFINFTLDQPYFQSSGKTLLLLCEEGRGRIRPLRFKAQQDDRGNHRGRGGFYSGKDGRAGKEVSSGAHYHRI